VFSEVGLAAPNLYFLGRPQKPRADTTATGRVAAGLLRLVGFAGWERSPHPQIGSAPAATALQNPASPPVLPRRTSRELYERQVSIEEREIAEVPAEEEEELALIYEAKGLPEDQAHTLAAPDGPPQECPGYALQGGARHRS
jgi:hypothetical protein